MSLSYGYITHPSFLPNHLLRFSLNAPLLFSQTSADRLPFPKAVVLFGKFSDIPPPLSLANSAAAVARSPPPPSLESSVARSPPPPSLAQLLRPYPAPFFSLPTFPKPVVPFGTLA